MATTTQLTIAPPQFETAQFRLIGTAPYVQNKFSAKARDTIHEGHVAGSVTRKGKKKEPKDFQALYEGAMHKDAEGRCGIPAPAFRAAMISACRLCGFKMTMAKLSVFVEADSFDADDATPLVLFSKGQPHYLELPTRNSTGVIDLRARPMWPAGWEAELRVRFDRDQFTTQDVANLLLRAGQQVGIGEGRPDSRQSNGMGWGLFALGGAA